MYCLNHEHSQKEKIGRLNDFWEPKSHAWAAQQFGSFCINIEDLDKKKDFFPVRLVKTYCEKNYFLLQ